MAECVDKNMIDKDEYSQSTQIEARCVHMLAHLWPCPEATNTIGISTTGSSEAAMLGAMALKWKSIFPPQSRNSLPPLKHSQRVAKGQVSSAKSRRSRTAP